MADPHAHLQVPRDQHLHNWDRPPDNKDCEKLKLSSNSSWRVLVADQSQPIRSLIAEAVQGLDVSVFEAQTGEEAWQIVDIFDPHIVVVEDHLPGINGFMLTQKIRSKPTNSAVQILMTLIGNSRESRITAYECGADSTLTKPCHPRELQAQIENSLRLVSYRRLEEERRSFEEAFENLAKTNAMIIEGWTRALDLRDKESEGHSMRVTELTVRLAQRFGYEDPELTDIRYGALLHDIGKIGIPDRILRKEGTLTDEERLEMQRHPEFAFSMLQGLDHLTHAVAIPYSHHEKWDGTGYPLGLSGQEIPFSARLFSVVDVYDALKSERPYKPAWSDAAAFEELQALSGTHFDPVVVQEFIEMMSQLKTGVA